MNQIVSRLKIVPRGCEFIKEVVLARTLRSLLLDSVTTSVQHDVRLRVSVRLLRTRFVRSFGHASLRVLIGGGRVLRRARAGDPRRAVLVR